jgi:thioredoxin reductase
MTPVREEKGSPEIDVVVVGGGPAGLSAALVLGRCRRRVLLLDAGKPRNYAAREMHGFLGRDCSDPADLRRTGREQLQRYDGVVVRDISVTDAKAADGGFVVSLESGEKVRCRKLLLATGLKDKLPEIKGFEELYGASAHHCPYCDGWEWRDRAIAVYGQGEKGVDFALELLGWSADIVLFTDGAADLSQAERDELARNGVQVETGRISAFEGEEGLLRAVRLADGRTVPREALFVYTSSEQTCQIASGFGCKFEDGLVATGGYEQTDTPGLYVAGDASRNAGLAIVAAAEGARAAFAINAELLREDRAHRVSAAK